MPVVFLLIGNGVFSIPDLFPVGHLAPRQFPLTGPAQKELTTRNA